jgi:lysophospholipase L1-like esterase
MQIVVFGDSQFDNVRDNTSIGYLLHWYLQADVYNCAMGGTSASTVPDEERNMSDDNWSSRSFIGMAKCAVGEVNPDFFSDYHAYDVFKSCDLSKTDIFIVEYGANDYFMKASLSDIDRQDTYVGALYMGMKKLMKAYPNAKIVFCAPTYAQFFGPNHTYIGDSNMTSNGIGTLYDYCCAGMNIAQTLGVDTLDCYDQLNMSAANADDYLMDGIHLSQKCRKLYAQKLSRIIMGMEGYSVPEGTDLDTADYKAIMATRK